MTLPPSTSPDAELTGEPESNPSAEVKPGLVLVATPIGNMSDMPPRGVTALRQASLVLCEDTRVTARLFAVHNISSRMEALHDHNEEVALPGLLARLRRGELLALVSDAGTPLVSDPGYRLAREAMAEGLPVSAVPGPNAALMALLLSGLPPHPFLFLGFGPARSAARLETYTRLRSAERAGLNATLIWHEAPHRLAETLADLNTVFGPRPAAVARELTKKFEEVRRGTLDALAAHYAAHAARGEVTLVVGPAPAEAADAAALDAALLAALAHSSVRDAAALVAAATGRTRKEVYARALALSGAGGGG